MQSLPLADALVSTRWINSNAKHWVKSAAILWMNQVLNSYKSLIILLLWHRQFDLQLVAKLWLLHSMHPLCRLAIEQTVPATTKFPRLTSSAVPCPHPSCNSSSAQAVAKHNGNALQALTHQRLCHLGFTPLHQHSTWSMGKRFKQKLQVGLLTAIMVCGVY